MENVVLVLGYNNTRIGDVKKIKAGVARHLSALTILCKDSLSEEDQQICDGAMAVDLAGGEETAQGVLAQCQTWGWRVIAVLPFSDRGTQLGAHLAHQLGLNGPDPKTVAAALDKYTFRQLEANAAQLPTHYRNVRATQVHSGEELQNIYAQWGGKLFIKPMREGNSRGCKIIDSADACVMAWAELAPYQHDGIMVEELVEGAQEYSWDTVAGRVWLTEKTTTDSHYRAEIQQIVPAHMQIEKYSKLMEAGFFMAALAGARGGACHNEIFYQPSTQEVRAVEPNLRPAGMRIWDLAALAYINFDPWKEWILWATGNAEAPSEQLHFGAYVGIRMIAPTHTGKIKTIKMIKAKHIARFVTETAELLEIKWTCAVDQNVEAEVKDNSGFLGYIIARSKNYKSLTRFLEETTAYLANQVVII